MRGVVATYVLTEPERYNRAFLGGQQEPETYAEWISKPTEWGGIPELKILSEHYRVEMRVVDVGDHKVHRFAGALPEKAIYLMYDGTHYNVGALGEETSFDLKD